MNGASAPAAPREALTALILAGGRSRRMGQDKVWMALDGAALIEHVVARILPLAAEIIFSANAPERFAALARRLPIPSRVVADIWPGAGPLAGLHAGLIAARHDLVLALAADMPFVNPALIARMVNLAQGFEAVVPQTMTETGEPGWEPLHALYRRSCAGAVAARLAAGDRRMLSFLADVRTRAVTPAEVAAVDPLASSFFNINTPEDWQRARGLAETKTPDGRAGL